PDLMMAWQELDRVSHELSGVGRASGSHIVPFRSEREAHFRTAEALLQSARRYLAKAAR
ncbi:MAG: hypothetical protein GTO38_03655, partial [Hydrogenophaga sp.]|nr:hypothetical protein [Hydrogenophaga sp.]NIO50742.1 hypothetical protein [Hydrogenophaga sp.]NIS96974.1 hypothetical protein [Hydrogenophaga sp.]